MCCMDCQYGIIIYRMGASLKISTLHTAPGHLAPFSKHDIGTVGQIECIEQTDPECVFVN